jgi:hypothetical protein
MKDEYIEEILSALRYMYPDININILIKDSEGKLVVSSLQNTKVRNLLKFNPDFFNMQLDEGGPEFVKTIIRQFAEIVDRKYIKKIKRFSKSSEKGRPSAALNLAQIQYAIANSLSCRGAARVLGVHIDTFKKYCFMIDPSLYNNHKNMTGLGVSKGGFRSKVKLEDIFAGKNKNFKLSILRDRLIKEFYFEERCAMCGYDDRRSIDNKIPLLLDFKDGNQFNRTLENMRFLCYNCSFQVRTPKNKVALKRLLEIRELSETDNKSVEKVIEDNLFDSFNATDLDDTPDIFDKFNVGK